MVGRLQGDPTIPTDSWTPLYPPGPFPPHGDEPEGVVDLGVRLRDALFTSHLFTGPVRRVLLDAIRRAGHSPDAIIMAQEHIDGFVDTWALGALMDNARDAWWAGPDGTALAVMARGVQVLGPVLGWPRTVDRRWPLPDEEWMREQLDDDVDYAVVRRGPRDGAYSVAVALDLPMAPPSFVELPKYRRLPGDRLAASLDELLATDGLCAVELEGYTPYDDATLQAREVLRDRFAAQEAMDAHGLAGLVAGDVPHFSEVLDDAPSGEMGTVLRSVAEGLILPTVDADRKVGDIGMLVWAAPYRAVRVHPAAIEVLHAVDGSLNVEQLAATLEAPEALVTEVLRQLVDLGALTRA